MLVNSKPSQLARLLANVLVCRFLCSLTDGEKRQGAGYQSSDGGGSGRASGDTDDVVDGCRDTRGGGNSGRRKGVRGGGGGTEDGSGGAMKCQ
jgi:hypothetical protein